MFPQNAAIGFVVLNLTFESPYSDMGIIPVLSFLFFSTGKMVKFFHAFYFSFLPACNKSIFVSLHVHYWFPGPIMFVVYAAYLLTQKIRQRIGFREVAQKDVDPGIPDEPAVVENRLENGGC